MSNDKSLACKLIIQAFNKKKKKKIAHEDFSFEIFPGKKKLVSHTVSLAQDHFNVASFMIKEKPILAIRCNFQTCFSCQKVVRGVEVGPHTVSSDSSTSTVSYIRVFFTSIWNVFRLCLKRGSWERFPVPGCKYTPRPCLCAQSSLEYATPLDFAGRKFRPWRQEGPQCFWRHGEQSSGHTADEFCPIAHIQPQRLDLEIDVDQLDD